jgi:hypothetical protein
MPMRIERSYEAPTMPNPERTGSATASAHSEQPIQKNSTTTRYPFPHALNLRNRTVCRPVGRKRQA